MAANKPLAIFQETDQPPPHRSSLLARRCDTCGKREGFVCGLRGFGLRQKRHEARCWKRAQAGALFASATAKTAFLASEALPPYLLAREASPGYPPCGTVPLQSATCSAAAQAANTTFAARIGYIGSPANLDGGCASTLKSMVEMLVDNGCQIFVGAPNAQLKGSGALERDMKEVAVSFFDVVLVAPGGPGAEAEAKRFMGHAKILALVNSADSERGHPKWMDEMASSAVFDLHGMNVQDVLKAIEVGS